MAFINMTYVAKTFMILCSLVNLSFCDKLKRLEKRLHLLEHRVALDSFELRQELEETKAVLNETMTFTYQNQGKEDTVHSDKECSSTRYMNKDFIEYRRRLESGFKQMKHSVNPQLERHGKNIKDILDIMNDLDTRITNLDETCRTGIGKYREVPTQLQDLEIRSQTKWSSYETSINEITKEINELKSEDLKAIEIALENIHTAIVHLQDNAFVARPMQKVSHETITLLLKLTFGTEVTCKQYEHHFKCYLIMAGEETWLESKRSCNSLKIEGTLPAVENDIEQEYLKTLTRKYLSHDPVGVWLDGNDENTEGTWVWSQTNKEITDTQTFWGAKEPNGGKRENCMHMYKSIDYKWNDVPCNRKISFICAIDMSFIYQ